jgi:hypothetical protein
MTISDYRVLIHGLPDDSRFKSVLRRLRREQGLVTETAIEELPPEVWSTTDWLVATAIDELRILRWAVIASQPGRKKAPPKPEFLRRPGGTPRKRKAINSVFAAFGLPPLGEPVKS